jgi:hypothetical protein
MDLRIAEQLQETLWQYVKICAFFCFFVASALLVTSLCLSPVPLGGLDGGGQTSSPLAPSR